MTVSRIPAVIVSLALVGLGLTACTPAPTVLPKAVVEQEGTADLDSDEFVVALRAHQLAADMAWNSGDFTLAPLTESTTADGIDEVYDRYFAYTFRDTEPEVYVGPRIWSPIAVEPTADGAEITVCLATQQRAMTKSDSDTSYELVNGRVSTYFLNVADDGRVDIDHVEGTQDPCDASSAQVVTFDPAPTVPEKITEGSIRKPAAG